MSDSFNPAKQAQQNAQNAQKNLQQVKTDANSGVVQAVTPQTWNKLNDKERESLRQSYAIGQEAFKTQLEGINTMRGAGADPNTHLIDEKGSMERSIHNQYGGGAVNLPGDINRNNSPSPTPQANNTQIPSEPPPAAPMPPSDPEEGPEKLDTNVKNSIPSWWEYMQQTSGGKGGAISRMAGGILSGLGNAAVGFAHGATHGKTPAPGEVSGDPFGLQGYGELQHGAIQDQQDVNKGEAEMNTAINGMIDKLPVEQRQHAMELNNQLALLRENGKITKEVQRDLIDASISGDINRINRFIDEVPVLKAVPYAVLTNPIGSLQAAKSVLDSDINKKEKIKNISAYSFIKPKERKILSSQDKINRLKKWGNK